MKSSNTITAIRAPGQRSISSTFLFRPTSSSSSSSSICCTNSNVDPITPSNTGSNHNHLSLSAFLDRKLHSNKEKDTSNSSEVKKEKDFPSLDQDHPNVSILRDDRYQFGVTHREQAPAIEDSVFRLFNGTQAGKAAKSSSEGFTVIGRSKSGRKKHSQNHLVVLGDDPKPKRRPYCYAEKSCGNKKSRPLYNHYENGTGWWDSEREGVDSDEVGAKDVWEGMGTTTLGGLDWH